MTDLEREAQRRDDRAQLSVLRAVQELLEETGQSLEEAIQRLETQVALNAMLSDAPRLGVPGRRG